MVNTPLLSAAAQGPIWTKFLETPMLLLPVARDERGAPKPPPTTKRTQKIVENQR